MAVAILILSLAPSPFYAGPFCDQFQGASPEKQGTYVVFIVDETLKNWPEHDRFKRITSDSEKLAFFADARRKIVFECTSGRDFAAGVALGEDLAIFKKGLIGVGKGMENIPK